MKKTLIIIIACILAVVLIAVSVFLIFFNKKAPKKVNKVYKYITTSSDEKGKSSEDDMTNDDNIADNGDVAGFGMLKKLTSKDIGADFFNVKFEYEHPGVVGMDAHYNLLVTDKMGQTLSGDRYTIKCDNSTVKINGSVLTVPYKTRQSGKPIIITISEKGAENRTGKYQITFPAFNEKTTFADEFDTLDYEKWPINYFEGTKYGEVKDGKLVFHFESIKDQGWFEMGTGENFQQAYGCFSAKMKMPETKMVGNAAFWLCTTDGVSYIKNKEHPSQSGGEIDVIEYIPSWGKSWSATLHWNGWSSYHQKAGKGSLSVPEDGLHGDYHVFSVVWTTTAMHWYLDDQLAWTYTGPGVDKDSGPMQLLLQLSKDDSPDGTLETWYGTPVDSTQYPATMYVDWVHVYQFK